MFNFNTDILYIYTTIIEYINDEKINENPASYIINEFYNNVNILNYANKNNKTLNELLADILYQTVYDNNKPSIQEKVDLLINSLIELIPELEKQYQVFFIKNNFNYKKLYIEKRKALDIINQYNQQYGETNAVLAIELSILKNNLIKNQERINYILNK